MADYYEVLNLTRDAGQDEVKKAFRKAALKHHPDKGGDTETFKEVNAAWETLGDEEKRRNYDRSLSRSLSVATRSSTKDRGGQNVPDPRQSSKTKPAPQPPPFQSHNSNPRAPSPPPKPQAPVNIPQDLNVLTIKELKDLLTILNMRHDDCVEKSDLIGRLNSRKKPQAPQTSASPEWPQRGKENKPVVLPSTHFPNHCVRIKIITMGSSGVGKSCLVKRYCEGRFVNRYITTIGIDYGVKVVSNIHKHQCKVNFFDLSGHPDFTDIRTEFYKDAQGVLLCYDCTQASSFKNLTQHMVESRMHGLDLEKDTVHTVVCGTKADLSGKQVSRAEAQSFANSKGFSFFETSAQSGDCVNEALNLLFENVVFSLLDQRAKLGL